MARLAIIRQAFSNLTFATGNDTLTCEQSTESAQSFVRFETTTFRTRSCALDGAQRPVSETTITVAPGATVVVVFTLGNATSLTPPAAEASLRSLLGNFFGIPADQKRISVTENQEQALAGD